MRSFHAALCAVLVLAAGVLVGCAHAPPLTPGNAFKDCADCPEMVIIPAGSFVMGSAETDAVRDKDEGPQRTVTIATPFAVARHEVTRAAFERFVAATGHVGAGNCSVRVNGKPERVPEKNWRDPSIVQGGDHPVVCVSWEDAKAYVAWLSAQSGKTYRLLSEAQWEYAARAGTTGAYAFGENADEICTHGNVADQAAKAAGMGETWPYVACNDGFGQTTAPVGSFAANAFGLFDMYGNAWEWVEDCYHDSYQGAPVDGSARTDGECRARIDRGGGWYTNRGTSRSAERASFPPTGASGNIGFRVARDLE